MDSPVHRQMQAVAPAAVVGMLNSSAAFLVARVLIALPFFVSGVTKLLEWHAAEAEMIAVGLHPGWLFNLAVVVTQLGGSVLLILGRKIWLAAGVLGVFTVAATVIAHAFWQFSGADRALQMNILLEHVAICGGLIALAVVGFRRGV